MNIEKFKIELMNLLTNSLDINATVSLTTKVLKGIPTEAVTIALHKENLTFASSVDSLYQIFQTGIDIPGIADMFLTSIFASQSLDKSKIIYGLINANAHKGLLQNVPHIPFYDMAITFNYVVTNKPSKTLLTISNELMEKNQLTIQQLTELAQKNTFRLFPCSVSPTIYDYFMALMTDPEATQKDFIKFAKDAFLSRQNPPSLTATCENYRNGSVALLNTAFLSEVAEKLGHDLLLLPATDQVFVILPHTGEFDKDFILTMAKDALKVGDSPILTRNVFIFNKNTKRLGLFV